MAKKTQTTDQVPFEDALRDLESTVQRLETGELSLEESLAAFEKGVALVRVLNEKLAGVERRVEVLVREQDAESEPGAAGGLRTRPLDTVEE